MNPYSLIINILRGKHEESLREKLKNHDFSIISENCWGGGGVPHAWYVNVVSYSKYVYFR